MIQQIVITIIRISLINNGIKTLSEIVASSIANYDINSGFIRPEQYGFRKKEGYISLFTSIIEICQRRQFHKYLSYFSWS